MTTLTFQNKTLSVINQQNQIWLSSIEVGKALGYSSPIDGVRKLYNAHQDEFTPNMTALIEMRTNGGVQKVRIFSLRGCHLIGMLSHTKVAKDFRKWVLDILDKETTEPKQLALPEPEKKFSFDFTEYELQNLAWALFVLMRNADIFKIIIPAMEALKSNLVPTVYSQAFDYRYTMQTMHRTVSRLTEQFDIEPDTNWSVLKHIRNFDPKAKRYINL